MPRHTSEFERATRNLRAIRNYLEQLPAKIRSPELTLEELAAHVNAFHALEAMLRRKLAE
jgi:hypothetical protein